MQYLLYISFGFVGLQLCNVLINFLFRQKLLTTDGRNDDLVSVLVPARNEETNIGNLLESLCKIKNNNIEILVCDDHSTDCTRGIIEKYAIADERVRLIPSQRLPEGWFGKNHACFQLAQQAKGRYLLFVDADVTLSGNVIADAVSYLRRYKLGLLSVSPKQIQLSVGEKCAVPLMNYILLTLLPLIFVRVSPFRSHAAANGQFMLFDAAIYKKYQPHALFRHSVVEDMAISRFYKRKKLKVAFVTGEKRVQCRMYTSYSNALNGFSKNIFMLFGNHPVLGFLFWALATLGIVPVIIFNVHLVLMYLATVVVVLILYAVVCRQNVMTTILFFPAHLFFLLQVLVNALIVRKKKNTTWKGRSIC